MSARSSTTNPDIAEAHGSIQGEDDGRSGGRDKPGQYEGGGESSLARFYMTSDLRAATGLTRSHLDFYLREGVILPTARTESGYLLFDDAELAVVRQVIAWRQDGVPVREIRARLGREATT